MAQIFTRPGLLIFLPYLLVLGLGAELGLAHFWRYSLPLLAPLGLLAWWFNYRRYRLVADTPTSRIASAALGRVELTGAAFCHPAAPNFSPLSGRRCVWYRCSQRELERSQGWGGFQMTLRINGHEAALESQSSDDSFLLRDGPHEVIVLPEGAEVQASHQRSWLENGYELTEAWIEEGDALYITGQLNALGGPSGRADFTLDVGAKLAQWKQDPQALRLRLQLPGSGPLSPDEWPKAVALAEREVRSDETRSDGPGLVLQRAQDGQPMLISTLSATQCARGFRRRAWLHAALAAACALLWLKFA